VARIAERLEAGRAREAAAERERERLHERMARLAERRDAVLAQARAAAAAEQARLLDEARNAAENARRDWQRQLGEEQAAFRAALRRQTAEGFTELARRALADLADAALEDRMVQVLDRRLAALDDDALAHFRGAAGPLKVATTLPLDGARRRAVRTLLRRHLRDDAEPVFSTAEDLLCGIELTADGRRLGWSLADYLADFERRLTARLDAAGEAPPMAAHADAGERDQTSSPPR
jgi:F-type H+-transporting ATPase subunit b